MGTFIFRILRGAIPVGETAFEVLAPGAHDRSEFVRPWRVAVWNRRPV